MKEKKKIDPRSKPAHDLADAFGYLRHDEVDFIFELCDELDGDSPMMVNIGAGAGTSGLTMRCAKPKGQITTVDIHETGPLGSLHGERNAFDNAGITPYPEQILGDSSTIGKEWDERKKLDLLFIDGSHTEEGLTKDIEAWLPHVKTGGVIVFHDYDADKWGAVKKVIDLYSENNENWIMLGLRESTIAFRVNAVKPKRKPRAKKK